MYKTYIVTFPDLVSGFAFFVSFKITASFSSPYF